MSSSNNDELNNAFGNSDDSLFPSEFDTNESADLNLDSAFGFSEVDPFAAPSESNDPFTAPLDSNDPFATPSDSNDPFAAQDTNTNPFAQDAAAEGSSSSELPFGDWSASSELPDQNVIPEPSTGFGEESPLPPSDDSFDPSTGKVVKTRKKRKTRKNNEVRNNVPRTSADVLLFLYGLFVLLGIVGVDVGAFMKYQMAALNFLIAFTILGLALEIVPFLLYRQCRRGQQPNFYDVVLGFSLTLVTLAAIFILCVQSWKYGQDYKAKLKPLPGIPAAPAAGANPATPAATPATSAAGAKPATPAATPATPAAGAKPATPTATAATPAAPAAGAKPATPTATAAAPAAPAAGAKPATPATPAVPANP